MTEQAVCWTFCVNAKMRFCMKSNRYLKHGANGSPFYLGRIVFSLAVLSFCATIASSQDQQKPSPLSPSVPKDQPVQTNSEETQKLEAAIKPYIEKARQTYPDARQRYLAGLPARHVFFVTARLYDKSGHFEQVFIEVREINSGTIKGLIASDVELVKGFKHGDSYSFRESELIDWTISKPDGTEEGNFVGKFLDTYKPD
jgi:hypothetical protein